jgi:uncharacterized membrane protein
MQEPEGHEIGRIYFPSSPSEFITVFAHFHRAEIARMAGWRDRIDRTTNWAVTLVAAMLSVSLSTSNAHHSVLMFAMVLAFFLLMIESRRYRFFDVYRSRVRRLERNYYAILFDPGLKAERDWQRILAADLILLGAWALKVTFPSFSGEIPAALTFNDWVRNAGVGPVSGSIISAFILAFYGWIVVAALRAYGRRGELAHGDAHV